MVKGISYGRPTEKENKLISHISNSLADYFEKNHTDRSELLCALIVLCSTVFTQQTPIREVEAQCDEIDAFCQCLKMVARNVKS